MTIEILFQSLLGLGIVAQLWQMNSKLATLTNQMSTHQAEQDKLRERLHELANRMQSQESRMSILEIKSEPFPLKMSQ
jgi:chromosome segregation ATPase